MINTAQLRDAVNTLSKIVPTKTVIPALETIRVTHQNGKLALTANNLKVSLTLYVDTQKSLNGFCVPAKQLNELLNAARADTTEIEEVDHKIKLKIGKTKAQLDTLDIDEFPITDIQGNTTIDIDVQVFANTLQKTLVSASDDDGHPVLTGIFIRSDEQILSIASADGFRLTSTELLLGLPRFEIIVPSSSIKQLLTVLKDHAIAQMSISDNQLAIFNDDFIFTSQLINGMFPDYRRIIPPAWNTHITVDKDKLTRAIKTAMIFGKDSDNVITVNIEDTQIIISGISGFMGQGETTIDEFEKHGPGLSVNINGVFAQQVFSSLSDKILIKLNGATQPIGLFIPDNETYIHVIMPISLGKR